MNHSARTPKNWLTALCLALASLGLQAQLPLVLPPLDSLSEQEVHRYTTRIEAAARALQETRAAEWETATAARNRAEGAWQIAKQDSTMGKDTLKSLEKTFKDAQTLQKSADKKRKAARDVHDDAVQLASAELGIQRKNAPKVWAQVQKVGGLTPPPTEATPVEAEATKPKRNKKEKPASPEKPIADILSAAEKPAQANPETAEKPTTKSQKAKKIKPSPIDSTGIDGAANAETKVKKTKKTKIKPTVQDSLPAMAEVPATEADTAQTPKTKAKKTKKPQKEAQNGESTSETPVVETSSKPKLKLGKRPKDDAATTDTTAAATRQPNVEKRPSTLARYKVYNPAEDVLLNPPVPPCALALDTRDEFSGEIQRETTRAELFRHTNPALKNYIKDKSHVICEASMGHAGAQAYLYLTFTVNDPNAPRTLGSLPKSGLAIVKLLDGNILNLYNLHADDGVAAPDGQSWTFRGQFALDKAALRSIRSEALDKIRLAWANGYEDYEVHNIRLLMRLSKCLWE